MAENDGLTLTPIAVQSDVKALTLELRTELKMWICIFRRLATGGTLRNRRLPAPVIDTSHTS